MMREQLRKEIVKQAGSYVQSAEAAAVYEEESARITAHYDQLVADGKAEIDAYREMLADIEVMKTLLANISVAGEEAQKEAREKEQKARNRQKAKKLSQISGAANGALWLITVLYYFLSSFITGDWHLTWLTFLASSVGSILISMAVQYNKGVPLAKLKGWHGVFWLLLVIAYFRISFLTGAWHLTWLLFIGGSLVETLAKMVRKITD